MENNTETIKVSTVDNFSKTLDSTTAWRLYWLTSTDNDGNIYPTCLSKKNC